MFVPFFVVMIFPILGYLCKFSHSLINFRFLVSIVFSKFDILIVDDWFEEELFEAISFLFVVSWLLNRKLYVD